MGNVKFAVRKEVSYENNEFEAIAKKRKFCEIIKMKSKVA